ncbi:MAG TPA: SCO family protein [Flavisolibacter sp.]
MKREGYTWLFFATVILVPFGIYGVVKWYEHRFTTLPVLYDGARIADFRMVNQDGDTITLENWENRIVVADFFFVNCPVVCPKMTRSLKRVQQSLGNDSSVQINSFSVDPFRDSVPKLRRYAEQMDIRRNWNLMTGDKREIYRLARNSFRVVATDGDGGPDDFIHSELLILVDTQKRIRGYYNGTIPAEVDELIRDIARLKKTTD